MAQQTPLFRDLNADDADPETTEIESCCMNCYENVRKTTKIASIKILRNPEYSLICTCCYRE